jgi:acetyltransferase-like isoleucine patch superfamily enzyme
MVTTGDWLSNLIDCFDREYVWKTSKLKRYYYGRLYRARCTHVGINFKLGDPVGRPHIPSSGQVVIGDNVTIYGAIELISYANAQINIGDGTIFGINCTINSQRKVIIGKKCLIALYVHIYDHNGHPLDPDMRLKDMPVPASEIKPITIGNNVWIGGFSHIQQGVTIGDNSIVAAHSVVTKDVPPNTIVMGSPARVCCWLDKMFPIHDNLTTTESKEEVEQ